MLKLISLLIYQVGNLHLPLPTFLSLGMELLHLPLTSLFTHLLYSYLIEKDIISLLTVPHYIRVTVPLKQELISYTNHSWHFRSHIQCCFISFEISKMQKMSVIYCHFKCAEGRSSFLYQPSLLCDIECETGL